MPRLKSLSLEKITPEFKDTLTFLIVFIALGFFILGYLLIEYQNETESERYAMKRSMNQQQEQIDQLTSIVNQLADGNEVLADELVETRQQQQSVAQATANELSNLQQNIDEGVVADQNQVAELVAQWSPRVTRLICTFSQNGRLIENDASGVATYIDGTPYVVTNRHVIEKFGVMLESCVTSSPAEETTIEIEESDIAISEEKDLALLRVNQDADFRIFADVAASRCIGNEIAIGDSVVILGYPSVGSDMSITATEGIISGFDQGYFITSAKIERGNSGGAAVSVKHNCFLGVPTLAKVGEVESFARILPF